MIKEKSATWQIISEQLGCLFAKLPLRPNFYTWMTLPVGALGLYAFINQHILAGILCFILAGVLDLIDGAVARDTQNTSPLGAFLDGSFDRFIDFFLIFSYLWLPIHTPLFALDKWVMLALFFAIMPSFEVAYANHRGALDDPEEKINWRFLNRGEMYVLMSLIPLLSNFNPNWAGYTLVALVILSALTTLQTLYHPLRLSKL